MMRSVKTPKVIVAGGTVLVGAVMLMLPGQLGLLAPWIVMGFGVVAVADILKDPADRKDDEPPQWTETDKMWHMNLWIREGAAPEVCDRIRQVPGVVELYRAYPSPEHLDERTAE